MTEQWQDMGYHVISMRDDWKTIYGTDVVRTGAFHWLEDYAENRIPSDDSQSEESIMEELDEAA